MRRLTDDDRMHRLYKPGGLMTVARGDEEIRSHLYLDDEGDLILPHAGAITNIYGGTILDDGWQVVSYTRSSETS